MSQHATKGVKALCKTAAQTVYVRKPDLVSCKTLERLGGGLICRIYLNTYFQRARLGGRLICEIGLYGSIYLGPVVNLTSQTVMKLKKDLFLNSTVNKQNFINVLYDAFKRSDYTILHAKGGADVLIVKAAAESAKTVDTILVMDDRPVNFTLLLCWYPFKRLIFKARTKTKDCNSSYLEHHETTECIR